MQTDYAPRVAIVGGGAAGFFAAITCAHANPRARVTLYEATAHPLAKVRISGGGRCNVTHACYEPRELIGHYPRGGRELLGAFHRWQPRDMVAWLTARGVALKTEADGRIFPVSDNSMDIVDCLRRAAAEAGVGLRLQTGVRHVALIKQTQAGYAAASAAAPENASPAAFAAYAPAADASRFQLTLSDGTQPECDRLLLATGGGRAESGGLKIARQLGHTIEPPVPSLFTFHIDDPRLRDLAGLSVDTVALSARVDTPEAKTLTSEGPLLITHWGFSGPATLKLSAWGARAFAACDYAFTLRVNFVPSRNRDALQRELAALRTTQPRRALPRSRNSFGLPTRLWERLVISCGIPDSQPCAELSKAQIAALGESLAAAEFRVQGKSTNKDEFVTCGGVRLREVDFKTLQSRLCPGLYFAGEVLDIDGVTGGFNFQAAWTTAHLAGKALAAPTTPP